MISPPSAWTSSAVGCGAAERQTRRRQRPRPRGPGTSRRPSPPGNAGSRQSPPRTRRPSRGAWRRARPRHPGDLLMGQPIFTACLQFRPRVSGPAFAISWGAWRSSRTGTARNRTAELRRGEPRGFRHSGARQLPCELESQRSAQRHGSAAVQRASIGALEKAYETPDPSAVGHRHGTNVEGAPDVTGRH